MRTWKKNIYLNCSSKVYFSLNPPWRNLGRALFLTTVGPDLWMWFASDCLKEVYGLGGRVKSSPGDTLPMAISCWLSLDCSLWAPLTVTAHSYLQLTPSRCHLTPGSLASYLFTGDGYFWHWAVRCEMAEWPVCSDLLFSLSDVETRCHHG